jgi:hypothetical protein
MALVSKAFQDIITFSRATQTGTYVNSSGYITNSSVLNYLTYSNQPENAAWTKSTSFVQQNLLTYSEDFTNAAWIQSAASATANATTSPEGTLTADKLIEDATTGVHSIYQVYSAVSGTTYTMSFTAKAAERTWVRTRGEIGINYFNLAAGTVGTTAGGVTATITAVGNGWYRCVATKTSAVTGVTNSQIAPTTADNVDSYAGTAGSGVYLWGAQLVQGSVPGDYRATTSAALPCLYADYNGALRARKLCENNAATIAHFMDSSSSTIAAGVFTGFAKIKAGERTSATMYLVDSVGIVSGSVSTFNLTTGVVTTGTQASIVSIGGGYFQCAIYGTCAAGAGAKVRVLLSDGSAYTGDGSSGIYIADAQLNDGSSALAYYNTDASAYNAPRFDYDPVTLAAKGLLVEELRANFLIRSSDFSSSVWNNASPNIPTVTTDATLSPDGTVNADLLTAATGGTACQARQAGATGTTGNFTASVFLKVGSATRNRILLTDHTSGFTVVGDFQVAWTAGVASVFSTASGTASVVAAGNGWYRCVVTASTASANAIMGIAIFPDPVAGTGSVYAWQAQLEAGAFATSVIPTVASQVTRAADVASVNTLSPWYNSVAGTLYSEYDAYAPISGAAFGVAVLNDGTASNRAYLFLGGGTAAPSFVVTSAGVAQASINNSAISANTTAKTAGAYAVNDFAIATNAGTVATDASGALPVGLSKLDLGGFLSGTFLNGHLRRITYYPRRLTNAELQTLTTL